MLTPNSNDIFRPEAVIWRPTLQDYSRVVEFHPPRSPRNDMVLRAFPQGRRMLEPEFVPAAATGFVVFIAGQALPADWVAVRITKTFTSSAVGTCVIADIPEYLAFRKRVAEVWVSSRSLTFEERVGQMKAFGPKALKRTFVRSVEGQWEIIR